MAEEYFHQDYPKMIYNPDGRVAVVQSDEEQKAMGGEWHDSPAEYGVETCPAAPQAVEGGYYGQGYVGPHTAKAPAHGQPPQSQTIPTPQTGIAQPLAHTEVPEEARHEVQRIEEEAGRSRRRTL